MTSQGHILHPPSPNSGQGIITSDRIKRYAQINGGHRYLEIGVHKGETFLNLEFPVQHAVDPHFQFEIALFARQGREFFEETSDNFFRSDTVGRQYDVMFLDGLHTFEQCFRDFCATMAFAHRQTIWLIDDTLPNDVFSVRRSMVETMQMRNLHGLDSQAWHGDVFKTLFAIHDFFPTWDYRTVIGNGNPQTVLISRPRRDFAPRWNSLEAISRLDFVDFHANQDLLNTVSDEAAVAWLEQSLATN